jgi:glutathione-specific gamma-glutamylcyclotransferase
MTAPRLPFQRGEDGLLARNDFTPERIAALRAEVEKHGAWTFVSEEEREASRVATLARHGGGDLWIFGYGSLMWNPALNVAESRVATIAGFERSFCLTLILGRASPDAPGLMLALDSGGTCTGVAHRIEAARVEDETSVLWMREMLSGAYTPTWVRCEDGGAGFDAITFVINRAHPRFAVPGSLGEQAAIIAKAAGVSGSNRDYLYRCRQDLASRGVADPYVEALFSAVTALTGEPGDPLPFGGKIP